MGINTTKTFYLVCDTLKQDDRTSHIPITLLIPIKLRNQAS